MNETATTTRRPNPGWFRKGHDARRHKFTLQECSDGFYAMLAAMAEDHPNVPRHNILQRLIERRARG